jgi:hypothetical protein
MLAHSHLKAINFNPLGLAMNESAGDKTLLDCGGWLGVLLSFGQDSFNAIAQVAICIDFCRPAGHWRWGRR